jgi:hypothetical protein
MNLVRSIILVGSGIAFVLLSASSGAARDAAQEREPIATDRPGLSFSPITVPRGVFQIEVGLTQVERVETEDADVQTFRVPVVALRFGATDRFELRAAANLYNHTQIDTHLGDVGEIDESGGGDLELGLKVHFVESGSSNRPNVSLIGSTLLPVGDHAFTIHEGRLGFALNGVTGWSLEQVGITIVTGVAWTPVGEDDHVTNGNFVFLVGRSLSDKTSGYVETGWFPREDADGAPVLVGGGIAYLPTPVLQIDAFVDAGVTDEATDWTFGVGVSTRFS